MSQIQVDKLQDNYIQKKLSQKIQQNLQFTNQQSDQNENIFVSLNKTLKSLSNDRLTRYNTQHKLQPKYSMIDNPNKRQKNHKSNYRNINTVTCIKFIPEPWKDEGDLQKFNQRRIGNQSAYYPGNQSFNQSLNNKLYEKRHKNLRTYSAIDGYKDDKINLSARKSSSKYGYLNKSYADDYSNRVKSFNYTNEQKARVSLDYLVHEKKQKKLSKMLKMKTHCIDKSSFKYEKMNYQSKFLIQALQKLTTENILKKSFQRAVDVVKKRTTSFTYKNKPSSSCTNIQPNFLTNQISCRKIQAASQSPKKLLKQKQNQETFSSVIKLQPQLQIGKASKLSMLKKSQLKVSFKPKRQWIIQTKKAQTSNANNHANKKKNQFYSTKNSQIKFLTISQINK